MSAAFVATAHADATPASAEGACGTATGKVIFEDKFTDQTGGWETDESAKFGQPDLSLTLGAKEADWSYVESNFFADNGDYCLEAIVPSAVAKGNEASVGLILLHSDDKNYYRFSVWSDGTIALIRIKDGDATDIYNDKDDRVRLQPGSKVALKLTVKDGLATAFVDGIQIKQTRLQMPASSANFGVWAETDKSAGKPVSFEYSHIRVTGQ